MTRKETPRKHVCIMGCGDVGLRLAGAWRPDVAEVVAVTRSKQNMPRLTERGHISWLCNLDDSDSAIPDMPEESLIYYFVPPPSKGKHDKHCQRFITLLDEQPNRPARIVAISTTGVYGNRNGELVSEDDKPNPQVDRAFRRYDMECQLKHWCEKNNTVLIILRVGGIYGPGRLPLDRIRKQTPVLHEELAPQTNRIHVDDLAAICKAAATVDHKYRVYNVSDGQDSNMTEYFYTLADYYNLTRPPAVDWREAEKEMSAGMLSYLRESRRVNNARMLKELKLTLKYPDLIAGLDRGMQ